MKTRQLIVSILAAALVALPALPMTARNLEGISDSVPLNQGGAVSVPDQEWHIETVANDASLSSTRIVSLVLDASGRPHISYYYRSPCQSFPCHPPQYLKYARWTGSRWAIQTVDDTRDAGMGNSLALDASGRPHISYFDPHNWAVKYARWTGSRWIIQTVGSSGPNANTSLALDASGRAHISYYNALGLKYARWTGSRWAIQTVDSAGRVGRYPSLALDASGYPHISYYDPTNRDLKYARWTGSRWIIQTVDSDGAVGGDTSLALDASGHPHISYYDSTNKDLKYVRWTGSRWIIQTVDSDGTCGWDTSLAMDASGYPHIGYYDYTNDALKYTRWTGSRWTIETVDSDAGSQISLALDGSDRPHIGYLATGDLKYAHKIVAPTAFNFSAHDNLLEQYPCGPTGGFFPFERKPPLVDYDIYFSVSHSELVDEVYLVISGQATSRRSLASLATGTPGRYKWSLVEYDTLDTVIALFELIASVASSLVAPGITLSPLDLVDRNIEPEYGTLQQVVLVDRDGVEHSFAYTAPIKTIHDKTLRRTWYCPGGLPFCYCPRCDMTIANAFSPVDLMLTDTQGRRSGHTPSGLVTNIPNSAYAELEGNDQLIIVYSPAVGTWNLQVTGAGYGTYDLLFGHFDADATRTHRSLTENVATAPGVRQTYRLEVPPHHVRLPFVCKLVR